MTTNPAYEPLLRDIEIASDTKEIRRIADMIADLLDDSTGEIAMRIAKEYFPDTDITDDDFVDNFVTPLQEKVQDAVMTHLGYETPPLINL